MTPETAGYVAAPTPNEKIHCVVHVVDASTVSEVPADLKEKLGEIGRTVASLSLSSFKEIISASFFSAERFWSYFRFGLLDFQTFLSWS